MYPPSAGIMRPSLYQGSQPLALYQGSHVLCFHQGPHHLRPSCISHIRSAPASPVALLSLTTFLPLGRPEGNFLPDPNSIKTVLSMAHRAWLRGSEPLQGYLAHKKPPPP